MKEKRGQAGPPRGREGLEPRTSAARLEGGPLAGGEAERKVQVAWWKGRQGTERFPASRPLRYL